MDIITLSLEKTLMGSYSLSNLKTIILNCVIAMHNRKLCIQM